MVLISPASASALTLKIVNQSDQSANNVFITLSGAPGSYDVPGMINNQPVALSTIPAQTLTVNQLVSGRLYVSYGAGVTNSVPFDSSTRFDWAELTVTPNSSDVANLTAVDQFAIGMRLDTLNGSSQTLETLSSANSNTVFSALGQIPGGPGATVTDSSGNILRVLSPLHAAYPDLADYVHSMSGQTVSLHTAFFGSPFTTTSYTGTFAADGSIVLNGSTNPPGMAPASLAFDGNQLISDIYTGGNTPNTVAGAIYRDLLAAFSTGLWGGKYGNDALSFCSNPLSTGQGSWCPNGFNQPAFGDARPALASYPTCEQYAAVINQYSDAYGNPYSDASKKVTVSLDQPPSGGDVATLQLTILPDSGSSQPVASGNPNCGAAQPGTTPTTTATASSTRVRFFKRAKVHGRVARVGQVFCSAVCGQSKLRARAAHRLLGRGQSPIRSGEYLKLRLRGFGPRLLAKEGRLKVRITLWLLPPNGPPLKQHHEVILIRG